MRYLITGGAGFIGQPLVDALARRGDSVVSLDLADLERPGVTDVQGSVLDGQLVDSLVESSEVVVHLAAICGVKTIVERPLSSMVNNLHGTEMVLQAAAKHGKKVFVASSSEVFGSCGDEPLHEESPRHLGSPWKGRWSYGYAKALEEAMAFAYAVETGLEVVVGRFFNVTGPKHREYRAVLPTFISRALAGEDLHVFGDGDQFRCFLHIDDCIRALTELCDGPYSGEVFNIGRAEKTTMNELAEMVVRECDSSSKIEHLPYAKAYDSDFEDVEGRVCDSSKLTLMTGWTPAYDTATLVQQAVAWARQQS
jgi:UDP-glucose 4-epimerase